MTKLNELQEKLLANSDDERMNGRSQLWDYADRVRWYAFKTPYMHKLPKDEQTLESGMVYDGKDWSKPEEE